MSCFTSKQCSAVGWLFCLAPLLLAAQSDEEGRYLEVYSQGYSRFEIADGNVVAFFTGGVEFEYLGYELVADELRYDHNTKIAQVEGGIRLKVAEMELWCEALELDGDKGRITVDRGISGKMSDSTLELQAGNALFSFPPGEENPALESMELRLGGGVELNDPGILRLSTEVLHYSGESSELHSEGSIKLEIELEGVVEGSFLGEFKGSHELGGTEQSQNTAKLYILGDSLFGKVDDDGNLYQVAIEGIKLQGEGIVMQADRAVWEVAARSGLQDPVSAAASEDDGRRWRIELSGSPVRGELLRNERNFSFESRKATLESTPNNGQILRLTGDAGVVLDGASISGSLIEARVTGEGRIALSMPEGIRAEFNLAELSGTAPVELSGLAIGAGNGFP
ncbi:hypothetical protein IIA79_03265 [bacterium]|nr:hypothetical protein [bacterium]